jgi:hypothetical protein
MVLRLTRIFDGNGLVVILMERKKSVTGAGVPSAQREIYMITKGVLTCMNK